MRLTVLREYVRDEATDRLLDGGKFDYAVDAIDTLSPKVNLIKGALDRGIPLVSSMGAGAKTDPMLIEIRDIAKSHHCPLAHMLRKRLHKAGIRTGFRVVFSPEAVREGAMILCEETKKKFDFICLNFANGDMVGHTGVYDAIVKAVKAVDACVRDVVEAAKANGYEVVVIADHGNADHAENPDGTPNTAHSLNPVPIIVVSDRVKSVRNGVLADVAPTVLKLMGLSQPPEMTGKVLVEM